MKPGHIIILLIMGMFILSSGCIDSAKMDYTPTSGNLVMCSDYPEIIDMWKTPRGYYVSLSGVPYPYSISQYEFEHWKIGQYVLRDITRGWSIVNLRKVNELESGFRDACVIT
jgi:hypothetical protein